MKNLKKQIVLILGIAILLFSFSQLEAQENKKVEKAGNKFCKSANGFVEALIVLDNANATGTYNEFTKAYNKAVKAWNKLEKSAVNLENVEIKESVKAYDKLVDQVKKIENDNKTTDATDQINQHIDSTADEIDSILSGVCK